MTFLTAFPRFSSLPPEIRLNIWSLNLPEARLVSLTYTFTPPSHLRTTKNQMMRGCTSSTPIPPNLHTNREARREASSRYKLSFNLSYYKPKIYFNPSVDVLYFGPSSNCSEAWRQFSITASMIELCERSKVRRLAVHESVFERGNGSLCTIRMRHFWESVQSKFDELNEVVIVRAKTANQALKVGNGARTHLEESLGIWLNLVGKERQWIGPNWGFVDDLHGDWLKESLPKRSIKANPEPELLPRHLLEWHDCEI